MQGNDVAYRGEDEGLGKFSFHNHCLPERPPQLSSSELLPVDWTLPTTSHQVFACLRVSTRSSSPQPSLSANVMSRMAFSESQLLPNQPRKKKSQGLGDRIAPKCSSQMPQSRVPVH